jgi:arylsulfatase A-like enzyme
MTITRARRLRFPAAIFGLIGAVTWALGCGGPPLEPIRVGDQPIVRLIGDEPQQLHDPSETILFTETESWPIQSGRWTTESESSAAAVEGAGGASKARVARLLELELDTESVHAVELQSKTAESLEARLFWARENEGFTMDRSVKFKALPIRQASGRRYRAALIEHTEWRGVVRRFRLVVTGPDGVDLQLQELLGMRATVMWSQLKAAQRSAWKMVLGHEVRDGVLGPPETSVDYRLTVAGDCELRVAYGLPLGVRRPVVFRAVAIDAAGGETVLFFDRVEPGEDTSGRWREARADLGRWRDQEIRLTLETSAAPEFDPARGIPLWANPRVVSLDREPEAGPNLLLISIDTLRADHMSLYGYPTPTTPLIDAWARDNAAIFSTAVAPSPWTLPSHASLFSGLDAFRHGINHDVGGIRVGPGAVVITSLDMMAERLRREGYETAAFTGGAYLHPRYGFAQGFDRFAYWPDRGRDLLELETGVDRTLEWLAGRSDLPFCFFLHTYAVHDPYRARQPYFDRVAPEGVEAPRGRVALVSPNNSPANGFQQLNRFVFRPRGGAQRELDMDDDDIRMIRAMYDSGVAYADAQVGRLLQGLSELGLAENTVVVITSDHGESLGDRGRAGHVFLTDDNLLVPLIIAAPGGIGAGRVVADQVRLIDVLPTVLDLLGAEPDDELDGRSLVPLMTGGPSAVPPVAWSYSAAANRGLAMRIDRQIKYTVDNTAWAPLVGREQLFDLENDPSESTDLSADDPRAGELRVTAMNEFDRRAVGLRMRIQSGDGRLAGEIRGPAVRPVGTKVIHLDTPAVSSTGVGEARLDAPPGSAFELHFEKVFGWKLTVEGALETGSGSLTYSHTFDVREEGEVETLVLDGTRWRTVDRRLEAGEIGFSVFWNGGVVVGGPSAASADAELAEQLRALGYVE